MRELPAPPVLVNWFAEFGRSQHGFANPIRSMCERQRFSARLEVDRRAPFCRECVSLTKVAVAVVLDYIVDAEASAEWAHLDLQNRMTEGQLLHAKGGLPDPE